MIRSGRARQTGGFSLVEVMVAIGLLSVVLFGLVATTTSSVQLTGLAQEKRVALAKADAVLSRLLADTSLQSTWSDSTTGDPKFNAAYLALPPTRPTPVWPTNYTYDMATDLGETFPKELLIPKGTVTIKAYNTNPMTPWTSKPDGTLRNVAGFANFTWNTGRIYEITVSVKWLPGIERHTHAKTASTTPTAETKLVALYYRLPP